MNITRFVSSMKKDETFTHKIQTRNSIIRICSFNFKYYCLEINYLFKENLHTMIFSTRNSKYRKQRVTGLLTSVYYSEIREPMKLK